MLQLRWGEVLSIEQDNPCICILQVRVEDVVEKAILYPKLSGTVQPGDRVLLNTMAVQLKLGTGGYHFVVQVENKEERDSSGSGHIMKLRYTPYQIKVYSREEKGPLNPDHLPLVVAGSLHSMVAPCVLSLHSLGFSKVAYIMTDSGALPIWFSHTIQKLLEKGLLQTTITTGHAFGGQEETVNVYTGILTAGAKGCNVAVVAPGPGHVGTGTAYGFSGVEQGEVLNAAGVLGCNGIGIPRVSFADRRSRHQGISHHSLTSLGSICREPVTIVLPCLKGEQGALIKKQAQAFKKKRVLFMDPYKARSSLEGWQDLLHTMGRSLDDDPYYFYTSALAAWGVRWCLEKQVKK